MDIFQPKFRNPFPNLNASNHRVTSPPTPAYNCFGWAIGGTEILIGPQAGYVWPSEAPLNFKLESFEVALAKFGFERCDDGSLEAESSKVVLFGSTAYVEHAARQLPDGRWTSKLGREEDIEHDSPDAVAGGVYGPVLAFYRKPASIKR